MPQAEDDDEGGRGPAEDVPAIQRQADADDRIHAACTGTATTKRDNVSTRVCTLGPVCSCIHVLPQGLLTRFGERQGPGYLEADANLRIWCYPARAGIYSLWCAAVAPLVLVLGSAGSGSPAQAQAQAAQLPGFGFGLTSVRVRAGAPSQSCRSTAA